MPTERGHSPDPYEVLGVTRGATTVEIHAAYRRLARRAHPDVGIADSSEMALLNEAWRVLRQSAMRSESFATEQTSATRQRSPQREDGQPWPATARRPFAALLVVSVLIGLFVCAALALIAFGRVGVSPAGG